MIVFTMPYEQVVTRECMFRILISIYDSSYVFSILAENALQQNTTVAQIKLESTGVKPIATAAPFQN